MGIYKINLSELRHPITIERNQKVKDEDKRLVDKWIKLCSARAKILWTRGSEYTEAYGINSEKEATFYIRYNFKEIMSKDRIVYKNKHYDIIYINNIQEGNRYYEIKARLVE